MNRDDAWIYILAFMVALGFVLLLAALAAEGTK